MTTPAPAHVLHALLSLAAGRTDPRREPPGPRSPADAPGAAHAVATAAAMFHAGAVPARGTLAECAQAIAAGAGQRMTFFTSGSTGEPRPVTHDFALLVQEAGFLAGLFAGASRVVCLPPGHHIYGFLFGALLPEVLGAALATPAPLPSAALARELGAGDVVAGFPLFWQGMAKTGAAFPPGVAGVNSTGPLAPEAIRANLALGLHFMTEIYGSTETGGLGRRSDPDAAMELFDYYAPWPEGANAPAHVLRELPGGGVSEPLALPDEVAWEGERLFRPLRRTDRAVQVAGVNVYPERVRRVLVQSPLVAAAAVRLDGEPGAGGRLKAFVVPADPGCDRDALKSALRGFLRERLAPAETPRRIAVGERLPTGPMGKPADWD